MKAKMQKPITVMTGMCDNTGLMSIPSIFVTFMDLATEHAPQLKMGADDLARDNLFWITVRTKVQIMARPRMMQSITASTWPESPGRVRCNRYYKLSDGENILVTGKTEWAIIDITTNKLTKLAEVYPEGIDHLEDTVCDEPYARIPEDFGDCETLGSYKVRSTDIDIGQHMNNAAYVKMIFGAFSCKELENMNITEADIAFRAQCYEGDELTLKIRKADGNTDIGVIRADGTIAVTMRLK